MESQPANVDTFVRARLTLQRFETMPNFFQESRGTSINYFSFPIRVDINNHLQHLNHVKNINFSCILIAFYDIILIS